MPQEQIVIKISKTNPSVQMPRYESAGAAGLDLRAFLEKDICLKPLCRAKVPTGLQMEIPKGCEGQVRPRSGLAAQFGVTVLNSPGTIDSDYRGTLEIILINLGSQDFNVKNGDRIAQLVIAPVIRPVLEEADSLSVTLRGNNGFGSTGL